METTFKIVLDKRRAKKNNTYPLRMRVYQGRDYKTYTLGIDLRESDWNEQVQHVKSSNPNHKLYNVQISSLKTKVQKSIFMNEGEKELLSPDALLNQVTSNTNKKQVSKPDILLYGKEHIEKLKATGHIGNSIVYECAINKLRHYAGRDILAFEDVNYSFIENFHVSMVAEDMKINGIGNYMRTIRALFNKAIREGIISADYYPFSKFQIKTEETISRNLTLEEVGYMANQGIEHGTKMWHYRNLFLLSYCLIGINFADLLTLKEDNLLDGRVTFRRKKTHKVYSIGLHPKAKELLGMYTSDRSSNKEAFILPFVTNKKDPTQLKKDILQVIKNTNEYLDKLAKLCSIDKPVTTYFARYSWANAARSLGYSKDLVAEALGHEYGNKVTGIYLDNYANSIIDDMNAKVIEHTFYKQLATV